MPDSETEIWVDQLRRDLGTLARRQARGEDLIFASRPRRAHPERVVSGVWLRQRYEDFPVLGVAASDFGTLDLAVRRAAYAALRGYSVAMFVEGDVRLPLRLGLQLRGTRDGSLESLFDVPAWIAGTLASVPVTALINLVTMLSWREAIRIRLRRLILTDAEQEILAAAARPAPIARAPEDVPGPAQPREPPPRAGGRAPLDPPQSKVPSQGALPDEVAMRITNTEPLVDIEIGEIRIRGMRPELEVVVQQDEHVTAVSLRAAQR